MLEGRKILVTGVLTRESLGFDIARQAQEQGADVLLTGFGRARRLTERAAKQLPEPTEVLELDVNSEADLAALGPELERRWGHVDGVVHAIAFAPPDALGGHFLTTPADSAELAFRTSAFSLKALSVAVLPLLERSESASIVGLDFDASVAWPIYDWMGVAKAGLEAVSRYLARDLGPKGIRVNLISAGPLETMAARGIPGFDGLADAWKGQAPLGWDTGDTAAVGSATCFLLSDMARQITGEILHVDGGFHAIGAPVAA